MNCTRRRIVINQRRTFYTEMVSLTTYEEEQRDVADDSTDPYVVLRNKTHTKSAFINFNLFEYIEETTNPTLAAAMARNVAWRVDSLIQNFSRQIFKTVREGLINRKTETIASKLTRDGHAEIMMALRDLALSEEAFAEFGKGATGAMKNIKDLIRFRDHVHEVAHDLVALTFKWDGTINSFPLETIDQAFARPVEMKVGRDQRRRIKVRVQPQRGRAWPSGRASSAVCTKRDG